jgi:IMP dehydrogenase
MLEKNPPEALTFDDVLLVPGYSEVLPREVRLGSALTPSIRLSMPLVSSAMDTVTEAPMATAMALAGGLGFVHKNLSIDEQVAEVARVKAGPASVGTADDASTRDASGRLRVGAAVGVSADREERVARLLEAGCDVLAIDTAHGHSRGVLEAVAAIRRAFPQAALIAGNVATAEGARALIEAGVDAVKVGVGPGSICTTRIVSGVGVPQLTAIAEAARVAREAGISVVADGGIKFSGDVAKALAAGGHTVMIGSLFAGTDEAPGALFEAHGAQFKAYRGMGSVGAMAAGSRDRYFQGDVTAADKLVPEGVEARVPYKGPLAAVIHQLLGGLRSAMGYVGAADLEELYTRARFVRISSQGLRESHVHDVTITAAAPNYR